MFRQNSITKKEKKNIGRQFQGSATPKYYLNIIFFPCLFVWDSEVFLNVHVICSFIFIYIIKSEKNRIFYITSRISLLQIWKI